MITGNKLKKIIEYAFIDHMNEGLGAILPRKDEIIYGVPCNYCYPSSLPFIKHIRDGIEIRTVNCNDISYIDFE